MPALLPSRPGPRGSPESAIMGAEHLAHHANQLQSAVVANPIEDSIGIFPRSEDTLVPQDGEVLGDVALCGSNLLHDVLDTDLLISQGTEDLQSQGVGHSL